MVALSILGRLSICQRRVVFSPTHCERTVSCLSRWREKCGCLLWELECTVRHMFTTDEPDQIILMMNLLNSLSRDATLSRLFPVKHYKYN